MNPKKEKNTMSKMNNFCGKNNIINKPGKPADIIEIPKTNHN